MNLDLSDATVTITLENEKFVMRMASGEEVGVFDSSKAAARLAFANGAYAVRHEYDLKHEC